MTAIYNLRTDGLNHRITKFIDGNVESSYLVAPNQCTCPRSAHPTCRHRQMLPELLARNLLDSPLFWDFDRKVSCDMNGNVMRITVPMKDEYLEGIQQRVDTAHWNLTGK